MGAGTQSFFAAASLNMVAESAHGTRKNPALAKAGGHRTLSVNPKTASAVFFQRHVIVVGGDERGPIDLGAQVSLEYPSNFFSDCPSRSIRETPGASRVVKIFSARRGFRVKSAQLSVRRFATRQVMIPDGLPQRPRPAMHHQPEPPVLVRLDFQEMIPAPQCCELCLSVLSTD
jgi:hypothetical protein